MLKTYIKLLRMHQWYKNLIVFIGLFFGGMLFDAGSVVKSILAFFSLAFISSFNYIINDIKDREEDRKHKEKRHRPIASGAVSVKQALIIALLLLLLSLLACWKISTSFLLFPFLLLLNTTIYSLFLKRVAIADIHSIAFNFIVRAVAGAYAVDVKISPWLVVMVFFIALFLACNKRMGDALIKKDERKAEMFERMRLMLASAIIVSYALYSFQSEHANTFLMLSLLPATFLVLRYFYLAELDARVARNTELVFLDKAWVAGLMVWIAVCFVGIYINY